VATFHKLGFKIPSDQRTAKLRYLGLHQKVDWVENHKPMLLELQLKLK
jgi:hypothetical protein